MGAPLDPRMFKPNVYIASKRDHTLAETMQVRTIAQRKALVVIDCKTLESRTLTHKELQAGEYEFLRRCGSKSLIAAAA